HHRCLSSNQALFEQDSAAGRTEDSIDHHCFDCVVELLFGSCNSNTFPCCQAVGFDNYRQREIVFEEIPSLLRRFANGESRCRDRVTSHELLSKAFAALETCSCGRRSYYTQAELLKMLRHAENERSLGTYDRKLGPDRESQLGERSGICNIGGYAARDCANSR